MRLKLLFLFFFIGMSSLLYSAESSYEIYSPQAKQIILKDEILIKGVNRALSVTLINGQEVPLREDGRFYHKFPIATYGKHLVVIHFLSLDPDRAPEEMALKILRLRTKPLFKELPDRKKLLYLINSALWPFDPEKSINDPVTRAELAYVIGAIEGCPTADTQAAIDYVTANKLMMAYPDNTFRPQSLISKLELMVTLVKTLHLSTDTPTTSDDHWAQPFLQAAIEHGLLESGTPVLDPQIRPTRLEVMRLLVSHPLFRNKIPQKFDFSVGFELDLVTKQSISQQIAAKRKELAARHSAQNRFDVLSPKPNAIFYTDSIHIRGTISPPQQFTIQDQLITPPVSGAFDIVMPLQEGANWVRATANQQAVRYPVYYFKSYLDMESHWLKGTAAKMRFLKLLPQTDHFYPHHLITRSEFAHLLVSFLEISTSNLTVQTVKVFEDMAFDHPHFQAVQIVVAENIMANPSNQFHPDSIMTKAAALTAIIRALQFPLAPDTVEIQFRDVAPTHWVTPYLKTAIFNHIVFPSDRFYPRSALSMAQFVSILAKTPKLHAKIQSLTRVHD